MRRPSSHQRKSANFIRRFLNSGKAATRARMLRNIAVLAAIASVLAVASAPAQTPPDISSILQQIQQNNTTPGTLPPTTAPQTQVLQAPGSAQPGTAPMMEVPRRPSNIEEILSKRAGTPLHQFGYELFTGLSQVTVPQVGSIQSYYTLGPGDEILVNLRGQENSSYDVTVDNSGNVVLPKLPPIRAAGRTFADFKQSMESAVKQAFLSTNVFISIGQLRRVSVTVAGEVYSPGVKQLTGLSTPLDALILSLGVKKSGSLRNITILRGGRTLSYDLYHVLLKDGSAPQIFLNDGDRIVVPTVGNVVGVSGWVRRPGIYELPPGQGVLSAPELIRIAGGFAMRAAYRTAVLRIQPNGKASLDDTTARPDEGIRDGEVLFVERAVDVTVGRVQFLGAVRLPGSFGLNTVHTLRDLLTSSDVLKPNAYMLFGYIERTDLHTLAKSYVPFSPMQVLDHRFDMALQDRDVVKILTFESMRRIASVQRGVVEDPEDMVAADQSAQQAAANAGVPGASNGQSGTATGATTGTSSVAAAVAAMAAGATGQSSGSSAAGAGQGASAAPGGGGEGTGGEGASGEGASGEGAGGDASGEASAGDSGTGDSGGAGDAGDAGVMGYALADYRATLEGAVQRPGIYLVAPNTNLADLLGAANGLTARADLSSFELTSTIIDNSTGLATTDRKVLNIAAADYAKIKLKPFDVVQFHEVFSDIGVGSIDVGGEVRYPGTFQILRGERLSSILRRAGGLTMQAYPYGAIFLRKSVARRMQTGFQHTADDIEQQLVMALAEGTGSSGSSGSGAADTAVFLQGVINKLRNQPASGRMTIIADPAALAANPEADITVQPGDLLFIPQRGSAVTVSGEVLNAGSFIQKSDLDVADYIDLAGGYGRYADTSYVYVINPDGTSRRVEKSLFTFSSDRIAPGSLIIVPRDLKPLDFEKLAVEVGQIIANLAVSAASLSVISRGN